MSRKLLFGVGGVLLIVTSLAAIYAPADSPATKSPTAKLAPQPPAEKQAAAKPAHANGPRSNVPLHGGEEAILKVMEEPASLEFVKTPLADVADFIEDKLHIPVALDQKAMEDVGIDSAARVTCTVRNIPLQSALDVALRGIGLTWTIRSDVLLITTPEAADAFLVTKVYDVSDLVLDVGNYPYQGNRLPTTDFEVPSLSFPYSGPIGGGMPIPTMGQSGGGGFFDVPAEANSAKASVASIHANGASYLGGGGGAAGQPMPMSGGGATGVDFDSLIELITSTVQPTTWDTVGGPASISHYQDKFVVVSQTLAVHHEIKVFLADLRAKQQAVPMVVVDLDWLWLDRAQYEKMIGDTKTGGRTTLTIDAGALQSLRQQAQGFRGRVVCTGGQIVHLASGDRRSCVVNALPTGGGGCQPLIAAPNAGAVLELCPVPDIGTASVVMHVCSNVTRWGKPKPPVPLAMSWGAGQTSTSNSSKDGPQTSSSTKTPAGKAAFAVDRPTMPTQQWGATIRVPLDKPVLLGAMTFAPEGGAGLDKPADNAKQLCLIAVTSLAAAGHAPAEKQKKP